MKKYRVLREFPFAKVGEEFVTMGFNDFMIGPHYYEGKTLEHLISEGWLEEVKEDKKLWEKLGNYCHYEDMEYLMSLSEKFWKEKSKIAKEHHLEVVRKASREWVVSSSIHYKISITDYIIQSIEKDGE